MTNSEHSTAVAPDHRALDALVAAARSGSVGISRLIWRALTSMEGVRSPTRSRNGSEALTSDH